MARLRSPRLWRVLLWILHFLLLALFLIGLYLLNRAWRLELSLLSPFPELHAYWLPILFLFVYVGIWLVLWFFRLLANPIGGDFPDIDEAWKEGLEALERAGIDLKTVPLFVVLGEPNGGTANFFTATRLPFTVRGEPRRPDAPLHIYANREAIFVTTEGISSLTAFSRIRHEANVAANRTAGDPASALLEGPEPSLGGESLPTAVPATGPRRQSWEEKMLERPTDGSLAELTSDEQKRLSARLRYLGRRIAARRYPYVAISGSIRLLPISALENEADSERFAAVCRLENTALDAGTQVHAPTVVVLCEAESLPGVPDLLRKLPRDLLQDRLLGRSFPLAPQGYAEERLTMVRSGVDWMALSQMPGLAYTRLAASEDLTDRWSAVNPRLAMLSSSFYSRREAITRLVAQGLMDEPHRPPLVAGVYLAATGTDESLQGFAAAIVSRLASLQQHAAWAESAHAEERDLRRITWLGYAGMLIVLVALVIFGYQTWK